ncbi:glutamate synthase large subunit [Clostridium sp. YIM B02551]|uniref:glutamate synthase large subunit n=1 Tax=Clostridium sp. YIM B02551 TaxID=2910679 RepID=UPI001EEA0DEE|nr:glutamate synthase large subunit [Clostridium sp. YIM B02551]
MNNYYPKKTGLYSPSFEHDACGIGAVANIKGEKSHKVLQDALNILVNLEHRGGIGAEENTGDGAGVLFQIPHRFFKEEGQKLGIILPNEGEYAVAMLFLSQKEDVREEGKKIFEETLKEEGTELLAWREVPTNSTDLGKTALSCIPYFLQAIVKKPEGIKKGIEFERKLYVLRRKIEKKALKNPKMHDETFYIPSFSSRTIVYKGMLLATQLKSFYKDLSNAKVQTSLALVHSRYSTNTFPSWERAHPNRYMIHNGEINTLRGNVNKIYSRESRFKSSVLGDEINKILPVIDKEGSDSAILDNTLEFLLMNGRDLPKAVMMAIPEPWAKSQVMSKEKKEFYEYYATMMEPWDGPAAIVFTDGEKLGAVLDRNGLRPARYYVTDDDYLILSSEVGVLDVEPEKIVLKDRLTPGKMLLVDTVNGEFIDDKDLKEKYSKEYPYGRWLKEKLIKIEDLEETREEVNVYDEEERARLQKSFGFTYDDLKNTVLKMAENGEEPLAAMGIDTPLAVLSEKPQPLFNYFKQLFAQVTNPPIDAIREEIVTATDVFIGTEGNLLEDTKENCRQIKLHSPILSNEDFLKIKHINRDGFRVKELSILFKKDKGENALEEALDNLFNEADEAYKEGFNLIILSDRGVNSEYVAIPSLLAVSGLHQHLVSKGTRTSLGLILESGEPREVHHFATLLGFGVSAVNPYLAYESIRELSEEGLLDISYEKGVYNFNKAVLKGIVKILSKMGISTIQSYQGAQIFEALGVGEEVVDKYFTNTISRIGGVGIKEIQKEAELRHEDGYDKKGLTLDLTLDSVGSHKYRSNAEEHLYNPLTIHKLQEATKRGDYTLFKEYTKLLDREESALNLRGLIDFDYSGESISIDEVESVDSIVKRFKTGAMSYGSISKEAHEALAIAMNRLGGKSNTGEGGEDPERWILDENGDSRNSAIKQVASGRFGVTSEYLVSAKEIQIKMAQGAKPGEGGQLPASKVYPWVARTRRSTAGVGLISPPPHHDIYSIEDLAQLIYDLKNSNTGARVSVKLVSEGGVGTIAAGVAKGGADVILISGYDGGTGASPRTSIQHAGLPWELGLAEAHQTLVMNNLRERVVVETDGKLMTGKDVAIAALLGAEEFGFATAPLVVLGCVMMRVCNLDTCPVGIATQNEELRKRFKGNPDYVVNFMKFIAEELREYMAKLGFRTIEEMVGRFDKLKAKEDIKGWKAKKVDLRAVLNAPAVEKGKAISFKSDKAYNHKLNEVIDSTLFLKIAEKALKNKERVSVEVDITNVNRTVGTILGSEVTRKYKSEGLEEDTIRIKCNGSGGQSFGAFVPKGLTLEIEGDSNDYFGKGLSGGKLIVYPNEQSKFKAEENIVIGNVALYGATSGKAFINGIAGERFCVRNSGAIAVVEGVGDHGCEYMTGGKAVILGPTGVNFAAGMSGGVAYVLDEDGSFSNKVNLQMVSLEEVDAEEAKELKEIIKEHVLATVSSKGKWVLDNFEDLLPKFHKVMPHDYKAMLSIVKEKEAQGLKGEEALIAAFYEKTGKNK